MNKGDVKGNCFVAQYSVRAGMFKALYTFLTVRHVQPKISLRELSSQTAINAQTIRTQIATSLARYSSIQLTELEQGRVTELAQGVTRQHNIRNRVLLVESAKL